MRISVLLWIAIAVSSSVTAVTGTVVYTTLEQEKHAGRNDEYADRLADGVYHLTALTNEYTVHHSRRVERQWLVRHASVGTMISSPPVGGFGSAQLPQMAEHHAKLGELFQRVVELNQAPPNSGSEVQEAALLEQLRLRIGALAEQVAAVSNANRDGIREAERQIRVASWIFVLTSVLVLLATFSGVVVLVIRPLEYLRIGIRRFGQGERDYRFGFAGHSEIGAVATAFDRMADTLYDSMVSRRELLKEIDERKLVEGQLADAVREAELINANLRAREEELRLIYDASSVAIFFVNTDGIITHANRRMATMFGSPPEQLIGSEYVAHVHETERSEGRARMLALLASDIQSVDLERRYWRGDGVEFWGHLTGQRMLTETGQTLGLVGVIEDITARRSAEQGLAAKTLELEKLNRDLSASNAELEQFAYVASHDLREPLRMISSYLSLIERRYGHHLDHDGHIFLDFARDGAKRMDQLVLDLLAFARIDNRGDPIAPMPIFPVLQLALIHLKAAIDDSQAEVTIDETVQAAVVMGDPVQVMRLCQNLIGNALKYSSPERPPSVLISCRPIDGAWEFRVADNGIGIDASHFDRIFGIFQRLHTRDQYEGTGIGLAICKKVVERHGGRIWVESVQDKGSTFFFTLPAAGEVGGPEQGMPAPLPAA